MLCRTYKIGPINALAHYWDARRSTAPGEGTIRFFPDLALLTAYILLRPFFKPIDNDPRKYVYRSRLAELANEYLHSINPSNWVLDANGSPNFEGVIRQLDAEGKESFTSIRVDEMSHPHLMVEQTMTSAPKVNPGDMVCPRAYKPWLLLKEHSGVLAL